MSTFFFLFLLKILPFLRDGEENVNLSLLFSRSLASYIPPFRFSDLRELKSLSPSSRILHPFREGGGRAPSFIPTLIFPLSSSFPPSFFYILLLSLFPSLHNCDFVSPFIRIFYDSFIIFLSIMIDTTLLCWMNSSFLSLSSSPFFLFFHLCFSPLSLSIYRYLFLFSSFLRSFGKFSFVSDFWPFRQTRLFG